ncbi:MAG: superoxide dismutase [Candidatus Vogelbacteria bacterium]
MYTLPTLPYAYDALEPYIDEATMRIHHLKHHQTYVDKLNAALEKFPELQNKKLEELLENLDAVPEAIRTAVRNHGGGHWNHSFFWQILDQGSTLGDKGRTLKPALTEEIKKQFKDSALACFGSGWTWLIKKSNGQFSIINTANQDTPISIGLVPILGLDLWEHAYYLKYQNRRADYVDSFFKLLYPL